MITVEFFNPNVFVYFYVYGIQIMRLDILYKKIFTNYNFFIFSLFSLCEITEYKPKEMYDLDMCLKNRNFIYIFV